MAGKDNHQVVSKVSLFLNLILLSYAKIFFSENKITGTFILMATFVTPAIGLCGLFAGIVGNLTAYLLGIDRQSIRQGLYGFNCVLAGLAIGSFYGVSIKLLLLIALCCMLATLLTLLLNNLCYTHLGFSSMSIPFNIITGLVLLMGKFFTTIHLTERVSLMGENVLLGTFPMPIETFLEAMSAVLFQGNMLSGILVSIGILIYSRIAFVLMVIGFVVGTAVVYFFGINVVDIKQAGFNCIFSALAIGGVWLVPSAGSLGMATLTTIFALLISVSATALMSNPLYPLAWPFNIAVVLVLYGLKNRLYPSTAFNLHTGHFISPEENLGKQKEQVRQFKYKGFAIALPFYGRWKITQGIDGQHTHQEDWRFAYDFQAVDAGGNLYKDNGTLREDFYAYGLPVLASAEGVIESIENGIADNPIGQVNTEERWGNHVIIKHAENYYSCLAHLAQGSIKCAVGQTIKKGDRVGLCGNSGRSPYPHIHLQFQMHPHLSAPSIFFEFSNICIVEETNNIAILFLPKGILEEETIVQNMGQSSEQFFSYSLNQEWVYDFNGVSEIWKMEVDFYGNTTLVSAPKITKLSYTVSNGVLRMNQLDGKRTTGLYLFGSLISEIPFANHEKELQWITMDATDYGVNTAFARLFDLLSLIGLGLIRRLDCKAQCRGMEFRVTIRPSTYLKIPFKYLRLKQYPFAEFIFVNNVGLKTILFGEKKLELR